MPYSRRRSTLLLCVVGSTPQPLSCRMAQRRRRPKRTYMGQTNASEFIDRVDRVIRQVVDEVCRRTARRSNAGRSRNDRKLPPSIMSGVSTPLPAPSTLCPNGALAKVCDTTCVIVYLPVSVAGMCQIHCVPAGTFFPFTLNFVLPVKFVPP